MHLIFAYGTLKKGYHNHYLLENSEYLGEHVTEEQYTMYSAGGFPIVEREGSNSIPGEVYRVDDTTLSRLNRLEGCTGIQYDPNNWYDFDVIQTEFGDAMMYVQNKNSNKNLKQITKW